VFPIWECGRDFWFLRPKELGVSEGKGFLYRFPDRDFQLGVARVPEVGETVRTRVGCGQW
jgi:hypothetical protein